MMRLPPFTCLRPRALPDAVKMLADYGPGAALVAGGTDLYPNMKRRQVSPDVLVSLGHVQGLRGVACRRPGGLVIGAMTSLSDLVRGGAVPPALAQAASVISSPQIRNMGTVGGNLCIDTRCGYLNVPKDWRSAVGSCLKADGETCWVAPSGSRCWAMSSADLVPVALVLGASVRLVSAWSERVIPLADLYRQDGACHLAKAPGEILTELLIPPPDGLVATYRKARQRATTDFAMVGVAAGIRLARDGTCLSARIVLGAVASAPLRCEAAEDALVGRRLTPDAVERAARAAAHLARPLNNADLPSFYRKWIIPVHVTRALEDLAAAA